MQNAWTENKKHGFTLVELTIVMAIIGIIAAVAWPTYQRYEFKVTHTDAVAGIMIAQNTLEKCGSAVGGVYTGCDAAYPLRSPNGRYNINIAIPAAPNDTTYTITGSRVVRNKNEDCGNFTLDNLGQKGMEPDIDMIVGTVQDCWTE